MIVLPPMPCNIDKSHYFELYRPDKLNIYKAMGAISLFTRLLYVSSISYITIRTYFCQVAVDAFMPFSKRASRRPDFWHVASQPEYWPEGSWPRALIDKMPAAIYADADA